jgi:hypothetical protein
MRVFDRQNAPPDVTLWRIVIYDDGSWTHVYMDGTISKHDSGGRDKLRELLLLRTLWRERPSWEHPAGFELQRCDQPETSYGDAW